MSKLLCKDCQYFCKLMDDINGVCSLPASFFPTTADTNCKILNRPTKTCKDCSHFINDFACLDQEDNDEICCGFESIQVDNLQNILFELALDGKDIREVTEKAISEFEQSTLYKFIQEHND